MGGLQGLFYIIRLWEIFLAFHFKPEAREGENSPITTCYVNIALGCFYFRHKWSGGGGWNGMSFCF